MPWPVPSVAWRWEHSLRGEPDILAVGMTSMCVVLVCFYYFKAKISTLALLPNAFFIVGRKKAICLLSE